MPGRERFVGLDAARGLAVVGMVIAHAATIGEFGDSPDALLGFAHGRSSILFGTIAGVSLTLVSGGPTPPTGPALRRARLGILGRAIGLLAISALVALLPPTVMVILASYALCFLLALPALRWRPRTLLIVAALLALVGGPLAAWLHALAAEVGIPVGGSPVGFLPALVFGEVYPALLWMAFVFAGMALGRCGLANTAALGRFAAAGAALFILGAAPFVARDRSLAPLFAPPSNEVLLWSLVPHSGSPFEAFYSGGFALLTISGLILLGRHRRARWPLLPLLGIGAMSLSAYVAHLVVLAWWADAYEGNLYTWVLLGALALGCGLWHRIFASGPLEQAMGALADRMRSVGTR